MFRTECGLARAPREARIATATCYVTCQSCYGEREEKTTHLVGEVERLQITLEIWESVVEDVKSGEVKAARVG